MNIFEVIFYILIMLLTRRPYSIFVSLLCIFPVLSAQMSHAETREKKLEQRYNNYVERKTERMHALKERLEQRQQIRQENQQQRQERREAFKQKKEELRQNFRGNISDKRQAIQDRGVPNRSFRDRNFRNNSRPRF